MTTKHKPATALPWAAIPGMKAIVVTDCDDSYDIAVVRDIGPHDNKANAAYIAHTANAYPELVEAMRNLLADADPDSANAGSQIAAYALLTKLGEA